MKPTIIKYACINALLTTLYIVCVAVFFFYVPKHFSFPEKPDTVFAPIMMLMLFVFSAAITASLVLGRPILWYLDGKKKEAVSLLIHTLFAFFTLLILMFVLLATTA
jgi:hypothetical protein